jgi:hypothetical protein
VLDFAIAAATALTASHNQLKVNSLKRKAFGLEIADVVLAVGSFRLPETRSYWVDDMGLIASIILCVFAVVVLYVAVAAEEKRRFAAPIHKYPPLKFPKHPAP